MTRKYPASLETVVRRLKQSFGFGQFDDVDFFRIAHEAGYADHELSALSDYIAHLGIMQRDGRKFSLTSFAASELKKKEPFSYYRGNPPMLVLGNPSVTDFGSSPSKSFYSQVGQVEGVPEQGGKFRASVFERRPDGLLNRAYHGDASLMLYRDNPASGPVDEDAARELELYAMNDADLYRQQYVPIVQNLMRKRAKGTFDFEKSVKLWMYFVDNAARKYVREFGSPGQKIDSMFNRNTRLAVARVIAQDFVTEADLGNWDGYLPGRGGNPLTLEEHGELLRMHQRAGEESAAFRVKRKYDAAHYKAGEASGLFKAAVEFDARNTRRYGYGSRRGNPVSREEIIRDFQVDQHGRIRRPGKFEGEMLYVPYFYEAFLDGMSDFDEGEGGTFGFRITPEDRKLFPELGKKRKVIHFYIRSDGFVVEVGKNPGPIYPAAGAMLAMAAGNPVSKKARGFVEKKFRKLIREGYPPEQAAAIAYSMARRKGFRSASLRMRGRRKNPAMGNLPPHIANDPRFQAELRAYRRRHGAGPVEVRKIKVPKGFPKFLSTYGEADHAVYDAPRHSKKGKRIHHFGKRGRGRPHLASSVERGPKFLAYVAGNFKAKTDWLYD